jgi:hypothetical protein
MVSIALKQILLLMLQQRKYVNFNPTNGTNNTVALTGMATAETM